MIGEFDDTDGSPAKTSELLEILFNKIETIENNSSSGIDGGVEE